MAHTFFRPLEIWLYLTQILPPEFSAAELETEPGLTGRIVRVVTGITVPERGIRVFQKEN